MKKNNKKHQEKIEHNTKQTAVQETWKETLYHCPFMILLVATILAAIFFTAGGRAYLLPVHTTVETRMLALDGLFEEWMRGAGEAVSGVAAGTRVVEDSGAEEETETRTDGEETLSTKEEDIAEAAVQTETAAGATHKTEESSTQPGVTRYEYYEPQPTNSPYYSDAGRVALTTEYDYTKENTSYFNDAVFVGDSRTLGISDYAGLDGAEFYCDNGVSLFRLFEDDITCQKTGEKVDIKQVLQEKQYGKIYMMLGINDMGYGNTDSFLERYRNVVEQMEEWQPEAIIYVMANLHISKDKNNPDTEFNNININDKNAAAAELADGIRVFYLDCNPLFTDEDGFLKADLTFDGVHMYAQYYADWKQFLLEHCVKRVEGKGLED